MSDKFTKLLVSKNEYGKISRNEFFHSCLIFVYQTENANIQLH